jgi:hypothetical protein
LTGSIKTTESQKDTEKVDWLDQNTSLLARSFFPFFIIRYLMASSFFILLSPPQHPLGVKACFEPEEG